MGRRDEAGESPVPAGQFRTNKAARIGGALAAGLVLVSTGLCWAGIHNAVGGIITSQALSGDLPTSAGGGQNILIMGLDSRLDQHGKPLPRDVYEALHAGDETVGGYNANVLILAHVPPSGAATAISIPRDDLVDLPDCPTGVCQAKIKQAYGLAYQHAPDALDSDPASSNAMDPQAKEQAGREAGRKAQLATVRTLLGVPIDHFVEVTLGAFLQIAKAVSPITVCLNEDTSDTFSGADFHRGTQQINAAQAMAFVRQRRDINVADFTDMDRTRRQQAFIASLVTALRHSGALDSPAALGALVDVAKQNVAVDAGFDLADFARQASAMTAQSPSLYTLPITGFGHDSYGQDVNLIDITAIRSIVQNLMTTDTDAQPATATTQTDSGSSDIVDGAGAVLNVINASGRDGLAAQLEKAFTADGFKQGAARTAAALADVSTLGYGPGEDGAAQSLAARLNLTAAASDALPAGTIQLTTGTDLPAEGYLPRNDSPDATTTPAANPGAATPISTVSATAAPAPTDLSHMSGQGVPCVK